MNQPRKVAILGGNRIPFARSNKEYAKASNQDMLTSALNGLVARYGLQDQETVSYTHLTLPTILLV